MQKNKIIFFSIAIIFTLIVIVFTFDMASKTTKPWDKKKNNILEKYKVKY